MRIVILFFVAVSGVSSMLRTPANDSPQVRVTRPGNNDVFDWNSVIPYNISVTDKEDGSSEYDEIVSREVFLKVMFLPDSAKLRSYMSNETSKPDPAGLVLSKKAGCFNCHSKKNKLLGPSFEAITARYHNNAVSVERLANKVIKGSRRIWGTQKMPPNPKLDEKQAREIVQWILQIGADKNVDFLPKLQGAFETTAKPLRNPGKAVYVLTASYTDHGTKGTGRQRKQGKHSVVLRSY